MFAVSHVLPTSVLSLQGCDVICKLAVRPALIEKKIETGKTAQTQADSLITTRFLSLALDQ